MKPWVNWLLPSFHLITAVQQQGTFQSFEALMKCSWRVPLGLMKTETLNELLKYRQMVLQQEPSFHLYKSWEATEMKLHLAAIACLLLTHHSLVPRPTLLLGSRNEARHTGILRRCSSQLNVLWTAVLLHVIWLNDCHLPFFRVHKTTETFTTECTTSRAC